MISSKSSGNPTANVEYLRWGGGGGGGDFCLVGTCLLLLCSAKSADPASPIQSAESLAKVLTGG